MMTIERMATAAPATGAAGGTDSSEECQLVDLLKQGDEAAFLALVERYHRPMLRIAVNYVPCREIAEEVVQETWIGVLRSIGRFAGQASLKTWLFRILTNRAKTRGKQEDRCLPFSAYASDTDEETTETTLPLDRFQILSQEYPGDWRVGPPRFQLPEEQALGQEMKTYIQTQIDNLPPGPRAVIILRDMEGCTSDEVCALLAINQSHQRVLLHRARTKIRSVLERYLCQ